MLLTRRATGLDRIARSGVPCAGGAKDVDRPTTSRAIYMCLVRPNYERILAEPLVISRVLDLSWSQQPGLRKTWTRREIKDNWIYLGAPRHGRRVGCWKERLHSEAFGTNHNRGRVSGARSMHWNDPIEKGWGDQPCAGVLLELLEFSRIPRIGVKNQN